MSVSTPPSSTPSIKPHDGRLHASIRRPRYCTVFVPHSSSTTLACTARRSVLAPARDWPAVSLSTPCATDYHHLHLSPQPLAARCGRRSGARVSQSVPLACWPRSLARPRQRYRPQPLRPLCRHCPSSWRGSPRGAPCPVAQGPSQPASCRLTCGRNIPDSINTMAYPDAVSLLYS